MFSDVAIKIIEKHSARAISKLFSSDSSFIYYKDLKDKIIEKWSSFPLTQEILKLEKEKNQQEEGSLLDKIIEKTKQTITESYNNEIRDKITGLDKKLAQFQELIEQGNNENKSTSTAIKGLTQSFNRIDTNLSNNKEILQKLTEIESNIGKLKESIEENKHNTSESDNVKNQGGGNNDSGSKKKSFWTREYRVKNWIRTIF